MPIQGDFILLFDKLILQRILLIFIQNAIKFSAEGKQVQIQVDSAPIDNEKSGKTLVHVHVVDYGSGISAKDQTNLFKPQPDKLNQG